MSTRCNVIIKNGNDKLIFYRHSDGYPDGEHGALTTLKKFMSWVKEGKIRNNVVQASGWLVLIGAEEYNEEYLGEGRYRKKRSLTEPSQDISHAWECGSYVPTTRIHGDIEYLYTLDLAMMAIIVQKVDYTSGDKRKFKKIKTIMNFDPEPIEPDDPEPIKVLPQKPSRFEGIIT